MQFTGLHDDPLQLISLNPSWAYLNIQMRFDEKLTSNQPLMFGLRCGDLKQKDSGLTDLIRQITADINLLHRKNPFRQENKEQESVVP